LKTNISFKIHGLYLLAKFFLLPTKRRTGKCPFYCQQDTVLNIIPVGRRKVIVNTFERDDEQYCQ
jgi:hypothetical protein